MQLHKKIFYLLLLLLPSQLAIHFWPSWSHVYAIRIDYLSPAIYLTDLIILLLFTVYLTSHRAKNRTKLTKQNLRLIALFVFVATSNILFATIPSLSLSKWLKLLELIFLSYYTYKEINLSKDLELIIKTLSIGVVIESGIAVGQFLKQASIGGYLYFLGERAFTDSTPGIAKIAINGSLILRPYATFPHPNVLAGYLAILLPFILTIDFKPIVIKWVAFIVGTTAMLLTFSRPAILIGLIAIIIGWSLEQKTQERKKMSLIFPTLVFAIILVSLIVVSAKNVYLENTSLSRRYNLNIAGIEMLKAKPLFGVGLGNFIPNLPIFSHDKEVVRFLQPAHSIFLLMLSETGIVGGINLVLLITLSFFNLFKEQASLYKYQLAGSLTTILILGVFDHYFVTLQQGQLLFALAIGLIWAKERKPAKIN